MFGFVDSASDHAIALVHFHDYAMFFLIAVIVFVVWILKLVLKFVVLERNLQGLNTARYIFLDRINLFVVECFGVKAFNNDPSLKDILNINNNFTNNLLRLNNGLRISIFKKRMDNYIEHYAAVDHDSVEIKAFKWEQFSIITKYVLDALYAISIFLNITKFKNEFSKSKTLYPDLGLYVNSFNSLPSLVNSTNEFRRNYENNGWFNIFLKKRAASISSELMSYRLIIRNFPPLLPYERAIVKVYKRRYTDAEDYLLCNMLIAGYFATLKYALWDDLFGGKLKNFRYRVSTNYSVFSSVSITNDYATEVISPSSEVYSSFNHLKILNTSIRLLTGSVPAKFFKHKLIFKNYVWFIMPFNALTTFYFHDTRAFFFFFSKMYVTVKYWSGSEPVSRHLYFY